MDNQRKNSVEKSGNKANWHLIISPYDFSFVAELEKAVVHLTHHIKKLNKCEELAREVFLQPLEKLINQARQERRVVEEKLLERLRLYRQFGDTQVDDDLDSTGPTMAQVAAAYRLRTLLEILRDLQEMQMKLLGWLEYSQIADSSLLSAKIRAQLKPLIQVNSLLEPHTDVAIWSSIPDCSGCSQPVGSRQPGCGVQRRSWRVPRVNCTISGGLEKSERFRD